MPSIDWFWFIVGIIVGKFAIDFLYMMLLNLFARVTGKAAASPSGM